MIREEEYGRWEDREMSLWIDPVAFEALFSAYLRSDRSLRAELCYAW